MSGPPVQAPACSAGISNCWMLHPDPCFVCLIESAMKRNSGPRQAPGGQAVCDKLHNTTNCRSISQAGKVHFLLGPRFPAPIENVPERPVVFRSVSITAGSFSIERDRLNFQEFAQTPVAQTPWLVPCEAAHMSQSLCDSAHAGEFASRIQSCSSGSGPANSYGPPASSARFHAGRRCMRLTHNATCG